MVKNNYNNILPIRPAWPAFETEYQHSQGVATPTLKNKMSHHKTKMIGFTTQDTFSVGLGRDPSTFSLGSPFKIYNFFSTVSIFFVKTKFRGNI
jgi:hypothetical protein